MGFFGFGPQPGAGQTSLGILVGSSKANVLTKNWWMVLFPCLVLIMVALTVFIARTQVGRAMRATSFDLEAASMMGIDVDRVIVVTFFIGSVLAGAAGVMNGLIFGIPCLIGFAIFGLLLRRVLRAFQEPPYAPGDTDVGAAL